MRKEFQTAYHALLKGAVTVKVKFEAGGRVYTYRALESDNLQVGDTVVIKYRGKFFTTEVVEVDQYPDFSKDVEYKWIVCKVDAERYETFLDQEAMFEQQMIALSAKTESEKVKRELVEQFGEENVGYLASIAQGKVSTPNFGDVLQALLGGDGFSIHKMGTIHVNDGQCGHDLAAALKNASCEGANQAYIQLSGRGERVNWESRYNKHIAAMNTLGGMTWRDFLLPGETVEDLGAVKNAKILFDRFKRKQYPMEKYIEEFKGKL